MTANTMPGDHDVHAMLAQMRAEAGDGGPEPSVLALARRLEMANTTFRRNYPAVVAELTRPAATRNSSRPPRSYAATTASCDTTSTPQRPSSSGSPWKTTSSASSSRTPRM
jgi:hypothetical protein